MNNFEKWKQNRTLQEEAYSRDENVNGCNDCPAKAYCNNHSELACVVALENGVSKMTIEELNELKGNCLGFSLSGTDRLDIALLIDAEIARQSVTDNDVQRAIVEVITALDEEASIVDGLTGRYSQFLFLERDLQTILTALQAYRKPTADAVQKAITCLDDIKGFLHEHGHNSPNTYDACDLAVIALRNWKGGDGQ